MDGNLSAPPSEIGSLVDPSALKELTPTGQHLDFRGLGLIDQAFVPLLEEVCVKQSRANIQLC
ncbi:unnamed protein product [Prunus armeniaca]|uniref:Uncharacterized protein n=1 Tax=Prunus armeniaca TaxID=36596 RepID=A0A6J5WBB4_PRUAR|nr:unnamed protein product [Prunus armeniaca]CAB4298980.1 unnamed protein product [Prunus armeniaca]